MPSPTSPLSPPLEPAAPVTRHDLDARDGPRRLRGLAGTLHSVDVLGDLEAARAVAIVGSRQPTDESRTYAAHLAGELAKRQVVVVSGGAVGIDEAAHKGALDAGGRTWCVLASTCPQVTPSTHADLFRRIVDRGGSLVWTGAGQALAPGHFLQRNKILVGLCDAVVVIQAAEHSGSRNSASHARKLERELWVVAPSPWLDRRAFRGNVLELAKPGARPLVDEDELFLSLQLPGEIARALSPVEVDEPVDAGRDKVELAILRVLRDAAPAVLHVDEIVSKAALSHPAAASALLTLCLEAVVVEGPGGFYRRRPASLASTVGKQ